MKSPSEAIPGAFFFFRKKEKTLMHEPKRTGQHQEPGKERQYTQVVPLPNPTL
jgi:hypothetical protein